MSIFPIFRTQRGNSYEPFSSSSGTDTYNNYHHKYPNPNYYNSNNYDYVRHESAIAANHPRPHPQQRINLSPSPHPQNHQNHIHNHGSNNNKGFMGNSRIEWREGPDAYMIRTELPAGIKREDVKVTIVEEERLLKITGVIRNYNKEEEEEEDHYYYNGWQHHHHVEERERERERGGGKFMTAFVLPEDVSPDQVKITMDNNNNNNNNNNNVLNLNVTLPKRSSMPKYNLPPVEIVL